MADVFEVDAVSNGACVLVVMKSLALSYKIAWSYFKYSIFLSASLICSNEIGVGLIVARPNSGSVITVYFDKINW
jgi:hypothetical protein